MTITEFKLYWSNIDKQLKELGMDPDTTVVGHRIHRFVISLDREVTIPTKYINYARFRLKDIHDDAVNYAKQYNIIEEYPFEKDYENYLYTLINVGEDE